MIRGYDFIIVGASGGIGQHLVKAFQGDNTIIGTYCYGDVEGLVKGPTYYQIDLNDSKSISAFCSDIAPGLKRPVLVYTPGISPNNAVHRITDEDWGKTIAVNLTGAMCMTRGLLAKMAELQYGRIVYISSVLSRKATPGTGAYSVSKAGLNALARVAAFENAKKGITVNSLALGYYGVGIISAVPEEYLKNTVIPSIPVARLGDPSNIVEAVKFLIKADYVTGATIDMNGGIISA